jgi:hypothetical protein
VTFTQSTCIQPRNWLRKRKIYKKEKNVTNEFGFEPGDSELRGKSHGKRCWGNCGLSAG